MSKPRKYVGVRIDKKDYKQIQKILKESKDFINQSELFRAAIKEFLKKY